MVLLMVVSIRGAETKGKSKKLPEEFLIGFCLCSVTQTELIEHHSFMCVFMQQGGPGARFVRSYVDFKKV